MCCTHGIVIKWRGKTKMDISITRAQHYADRVRKYKIFIDDIYIGDIANNETKKFTIPQGQHSLYFKIDWCKSNTLTITSDKNSKFFTVSPNATGWKGLFAIAYITFFKNKYLWAREIKEIN